MFREYLKQVEEGSDMMNFVPRNSKQLTANKQNNKVDNDAESEFVQRLTKKAQTAKKGIKLTGMSKQEVFDLLDKL